MSTLCLLSASRLAPANCLRNQLAIDCFKTACMRIFIETPGFAERTECQVAGLIASGIIRGAAQTPDKRAGNLRD